MALFDRVGVLSVSLLALSACGGGGGSGGGSSTQPPPPPPPPTTTLVDQALPLTGEYFFVHDPTVIEIEGKYHVFHTSNAQDPEGLIYWRTSDDLLDWSLVGSVYDDVPEWAFDETGATGLWAPDVVVHDGEVRLYYSASQFGVNNSAIGLTTAPVASLDLDDPQSNWTDQGMVYESEPGNNYNAIDPAILVDQDGNHWMSFGSFWSGIQMIELDPDTGKPPSGATHFQIAERGFGGNAIEAPYITYRDGFYYLFVSRDSCCQGSASTYNVVVGRSENPDGPYVDHLGTPMLQNGGLQVLEGTQDTPDRFVGPGHNAILEEDGEYFIVYHAYDRTANGLPRLRIRKLVWDNDGWPAIEPPVSQTP